MIERVQYNAALEITGAIKGTSQLNIYKELGSEFRRRVRCLCIFYVALTCMLCKLRSTQTSKYLINIIPSGNRIYNTRSQNQIVEQIYLNTLSFHI